MPYPVNNYTTQNGYTDAGTIQYTPPARSMTLLVTGNSIYYQFTAVTTGLRDSEQWLPETFVPPGRYFFDPSDLPPSATGFSRLRFRSGVAGLPAQVSAS